MRTNHGVLHRIEESAEHYYTILKSGFLCWFGSDPINTLDVLLAHAEEYELTHLWIMPGAIYKPNVAFGERYNHSQWNLRHHYQGEGEQARLKTVTGWRIGGGEQITIIFCENTRWHGTAPAYGWLASVTGPQLLGVIEQIEHKLGVPMAGSPQTMGWNLVRELHPEWIADYPRCDLRTMHFTARAARDMIETIPPRTRKRFLHKFDKDGHYLASAASTEFGTGTPVKQFFYDPKAVGVYNVTVKGYSASKNPISPYTASWLLIPHIRVLESAKACFTTEEGNVFPTKHKLLAKWASILWEAKHELTGPAREAIKQIYTSTIGLTSSHRLDGEETDKKRPDIKYQIAARGYEIMWHNIQKIARLTGAYPCITYNDAIYLLHDNPDGREAFPVIVEREGKLGGFRYEGCIEIADDVWELLHDDCSAAVKLHFLNEKGWSYASHAVMPTM